MLDAKRTVIFDATVQADGQFALTGFSIVPVVGVDRMVAFVSRLNRSGLLDASFANGGTRTFAFSGNNSRGIAIATVGSSLFVGGMTSSTADPATDVPTAFGVAKFQSPTPPVTIAANGIITVNGSGGADVVELEEEDSLGFTQITLNGLEYTFNKSQVTGVQVFANGGNDTIRDQDEFGRPATLDGGSGDDFFRVAEAQPPVVIGAGGNDTVELNDFSSVISFDGGSGTDTFLLDPLTTVPFDLRLYPTVDNALGGVGRIIGNALNNRLSLSGEGELLGGEENDTLIAAAGFKATLNGEGGDDVLVSGRLAADVLIGGGGSDLADYSARTNPLFIGIGTIAGGSGEAGEGDSISTDVEKVRGGSAADKISGSEGPNVLSGGGGNDSLSGNGGNDALFGEGGDDRLDGFAGNDYLDGGSGNDRLSGGSGVDEFRGWAGNDRLFALDGNIEIVDGGSGFDQAQIDSNDNDTSIESFIA